MPRRTHEIVVTGIGVVTPLGNTVDTFWSNVLEGAEGLRGLSRFDVGGLSSAVGAEISSPNPGEPKGRHGLEWALGAATQAVSDASLLQCGIDPRLLGCALGTVTGTRPALEDAITASGGLASDCEATRMWENPALASRTVARQLGALGPNCTLATACAGGNSAIAYGAEALRTGRADAMVVGGFDEISLASLLVFDSFRALTNDCVRPFDLNRRGLALGEGAAALAIERREDANARRAPVLGTILGWANVCDSHHITAPHPQGDGAARGMRLALANAGIDPSDVDHISAHGTGTIANDRAEARAIQAVFGDIGEGSVPVTALKSMIGHAQGAASAIEAVACLLALRDGVIPPTINHDTQDPECALDVVRCSRRPSRMRVALSNAFGFGGNIECVLFAS